jgi:glycosyltransferase involved in cell wall biosynthesis
MEIPIYIGHRWAQPSVKHLRKLMRHVVEHPQEAKAKGKRARKDIVAKYSQENVAEIVLERLQAIENKLSAHKTDSTTAVVWEGQQFAHHSFAIINRELCKRFITTGYDLSVWPVGSDQFVPKKNSLLARLSACVHKPLTKVDAHVRHHWPPNLNPPARGHWVIFQPWEFGSLPKEWARVFASQVDELWVPSNYVKRVYVESGVPESRVFVIPLGIDPNVFHPSVKPFKLKTRKRFKFLFVGGTIYRKGIDLLLDAYVRQFTRSDDVCLVIKDMGGESFYQGQTFKAKIRELQKDPNAPEIEYIDNILSVEELSSLYRACDTLVHPYRGEGFGLPILEAMACGLPPIVTNGGACLDFCNEQNSLLVKANKKRFAEKSIDGMETVDYPWLFEVELEDLQNTMRYGFEHPEELKALGIAASTLARREWTWEKSFDVVRERIEALKNLPIRRHRSECFLKPQRSSQSHDIVNIPLLNRTDHTEAVVSVKL